MYKRSKAAARGDAVARLHWDDPERSGVDFRYRPHLEPFPHTSPCTVNVYLGDNHKNGPESDRVHDESSRLFWFSVLNVGVFTAGKDAQENNYTNHPVYAANTLREAAVLQNLWCALYHRGDAPPLRLPAVVDFVFVHTGPTKALKPKKGSNYTIKLDFETSGAVVMQTLPTSAISRATATSSSAAPKSRSAMSTGGKGPRPPANHSEDSASRVPSQLDTVMEDDFGGDTDHPRFHDLPLRKQVSILEELAEVSTITTHHLKLAWAMCQNKKLPTQELGKVQKLYARMQELHLQAHPVAAPDVPEFSEARVNPSGGGSRMAEVMEREQAAVQRLAAQIKREQVGKEMKVGTSILTALRARPSAESDMYWDHVTSYNDDEEAKIADYLRDQASQTPVPRSVPLFDDESQTPVPRSVPLFDDESMDSLDSTDSSALSSDSMASPPARTATPPSLLARPLVDNGHLIPMVDRGHSHVWTLGTMGRGPCIFGSAEHALGLQLTDLDLSLSGDILKRFGNQYLGLGNPNRNFFYPLRELDLALAQLEDHEHLELLDKVAFVEWTGKRPAPVFPASMRS